MVQCLHIRTHLWVIFEHMFPIHFSLRDGSHKKIFKASIDQRYNHITGQNNWEINKFCCLFAIVIPTSNHWNLKHWNCRIQGKVRSSPDPRMQTLFTTIATSPWGPTAKTMKTIFSNPHLFGGKKTIKWTKHPKCWRAICCTNLFSNALSNIPFTKEGPNPRVDVKTTVLPTGQWQNKEKRANKNC